MLYQLLFWVHILGSSFLAVFRNFVLTKTVSGLVSEVLHNFCIQVCLHILLFSHKMDTHLKFMANWRPNFMAKHRFKTEDCGQRLVDSRGPARLQLRRSWHAGSPTVDLLTILRLSGMTYRVQESQWRLQSGSRALQHSLVTMSAVCCASLCPLMTLRWLLYENNHSSPYILLTCIHKSSITI